ncbi:MAG: hypothetical protein CEN90_735 [Parcubacteria group bacterium Licking1014_17]|nr:MAG: hypothetical protein CEN90_735 [Parcubacteria group bacterium Licking1014_17]
MNNKIIKKIGRYVPALFVLRTLLFRIAPTAYADINDPLKGATIQSLIDKIGAAIYDIAIPIAVIIIIYAGILFLTSSGDPTKVGKAKKALWYAIIGLAIVFIGKGFVSLIKSILGAQQ